MDLLNGMLTVGELIEKLQTLDPSLKVGFAHDDSFAPLKKEDFFIGDISVKYRSNFPQEATEFKAFYFNSDDVIMKYMR